jgi:hypothetical protein
MSPDVAAELARIRALVEPPTPPPPLPSPADRVLIVIEAEPDRWWRTLLVARAVGLPQAAATAALRELVERGAIETGRRYGQPQFRLVAKEPIQGPWGAEGGQVPADA